MHANLAGVFLIDIGVIDQGSSFEIVLNFIVVDLRVLTCENLGNGIGEYFVGRKALVPLNNL